MPRLLLRVLLVILALGAASAQAAEGMWTMDNLPKRQMQARYGFSPDPTWVSHIQKSAVRLAGGCSGSFVSPDGLVLTNHHCVNDCVQQLSTANRDYIKDGFIAKTRPEEQRCPDIELNRLDAITDVSARIRKATAGLQGEAFAKARKAEQSRIEGECTGKNSETSRCDVVELYHGGLYHLYQYRRYRDVRLAFAPELAAAFFGGDPDNFNFPRYALDMSLLRAYENNKPAKVADFLRFDPKGAAPGELVMTVGHPGSTQRGLTVAQLETLRDLVLPQRLFLSSEFRGLLTQYRSAGGEAERVAQSDLFSVENGLKARKGQLEALLDPAVFQFKQSQETALRAFVAKDPKLAADVGDAWDAIAKADATWRILFQPHRLLEQSAGFDSEMYGHARRLVRAAAERAKPNAERLREYTDGALPRVEQALLSTAPINADYERVKLGWSLTKLRELLGADDPFVRRLFATESPEQLAARVVKDSALADPAVRKQLWTGGAAAVAASGDPMIALAMLVDPEARALRTRFDNEVQAVNARNAERIATATFAKDGTDAYPDATFSLRLSYGEVGGWVENGKIVPPYTEASGAWQRHTGYEPFKLPDSLLAAKDRLKPTQRYNFVSSNDIIGGNSGSPVINRRGDIVGLAFDGNIRSLGGAYWFDERNNRTVSVHSGLIVEALGTIYDAKHLRDELSIAQ